MRYKSPTEIRKRATFTLSQDTISNITEYSEKSEITMSKYVEQSCYLSLLIRVLIAQVHEGECSPDDCWEILRDRYIDKFHLYDLDKWYEEYREMKKELEEERNRRQNIG